MISDTLRDRSDQAYDQPMTAGLSGPRSQVTDKYESAAVRCLPVASYPSFLSSALGVNLPMDITDDIEGLRIAVLSIAVRLSPRYVSSRFCSFARRCE
jgi:hypothetical protein